MESFEQQLARIIKRREQATQEIFAAVALNLSEKVITRTPVDTGRARGNWNSSINKANESVRQNAVRYEPMRRATTQAGKLVLGDTFYLTNGLPYIRALEYGSSSQAPSGMVTVSIEEFQQAVTEAVNNA